MGKPRKVDEDGNVQRHVVITLHVTLHMRPDATERDIVGALGENDVSWSPVCELVDYGFGC